MPVIVQLESQADAIDVLQYREAGASLVLFNPVQSFHGAGLARKIKDGLAEYFSTTNMDWQMVGRSPRDYFIL